MGGCSGTLVHPEIALFAAHCGGAFSVGFGTTGDDRVVVADYCNTSPDYPASGTDYAYCKLSQPVDDVPIVPILMGCDRDQLIVDAPVVLVGFGNTANGGGGFGTKRWIDGTVAGFPADGKMIGIFYEDPDTGICNGDSGGSAYLRLADGSWRMFGIASTVPGSCGGSSQHTPAWAAVAWIEEDSGIDISPCHDADGAWNPSAGCTGFPLDAEDGAGLTWAQGCGPGMQSGASATCGPAVGEPQDVVAPSIEIVAPLAGGYPGPQHVTAIEVAGSDDWGILDVSISIGGRVQATLEDMPYALPSVGFPEGTWEITATARDWSGNVAEAVPVVIEVGVDAAEGSGSTGAEESGGGAGTQADAEGSDGGGETGGSTGAGDETGAGASGDEDGCSCGARGRRGGFVGWALGLALFCRSRARRGGLTGP
jgi:hypothetical protein